ncbi:uncharacterized protein B0H18DRAFT_106235 [Fomitopsis serialis]|uniref:uncharacterized protein n=1 Tax=Fomitopsis serialis TaxID=139415 RepID=UPI002008B9EB|nr:uncharacterized protein B0H18DRAFT_106235 [Neoantrodia serialis]KAH9915227.1 hypothetical protein B0H18DRAFT_106235 [Neoantrodia serialis]
MTAPNIKFAARTVTTFLAYHLQNRDGATFLPTYRAPLGTVVHDTPLSAFLNPLTRGIYVGPALGRGPELATLREILRVLPDPPEDADFGYPPPARYPEPLAMPWGLWQKHHDFAVPALDAVTLEEERVRMLSAHGMVAALTMGHHLLAPKPIHPLVILWAILGDRAFEMSVELLKQFDSSAAEELRPWFELGYDERLPSEGAYWSHPVWRLLMHHFGMQPHRIGFAPDAAKRLEYTRQLISSVVLGKISNSAAELIAFRRGFNLDFTATDSEGTGILSLTELFTSPDERTFGDRCLDPVVILRTLYDRTVNKPHDVVRLIVFLFTPGSPQSERSLYERILQGRLLRWLHGPGHPDHTLCATPFLWIATTVICRRFVHGCFCKQHRSLMICLLIR